MDWRNSNAHPPRPIAPEPHPYTVEPGRVDLELHPFFYAHNRRHPDGENVRVNRFTSSALAKFGFFHDVDVQIGFDLFVWESVKEIETGQYERDRGLGDITLASKWNLWGNDQNTSSAFSVMPFVQLPTARHDLGSRAVQGGASFPFAFIPAEGWEIEWTPHLAAIRDSEDNRYEMEAGSLLVFNREFLREDLELFLEFNLLGNTEPRAPWIGALSPGFTFQATPEIVFEGGAVFGLTRAADDLAGFMTLIVRF